MHGHQGCPSSFAHTRVPALNVHVLLLCLVVGALSPNSLLNPPFEDLSLLFGLTLLVLVGCCCGVCLACSFGEELDFSTEDGRSASAGDGLGFVLETGGGDLVKKLKRELCFAMCASLNAVFTVL